MGSSHNCTYLSHFAASVLNLTGRTDKIVLGDLRLNLEVELPKLRGSPAQAGRACGRCGGHHGCKPITGLRAGEWYVSVSLPFQDWKAQVRHTFVHEERYGTSPTNMTWVDGWQVWGCLEIGDESHPTCMLNECYKWPASLTLETQVWGLEHWLIQPGNLRWNVNLSSYQDTHTHNLSLLQDQFKFRANFSCGNVSTFCLPKHCTRHEGGPVPVVFVDFVPTSWSSVLLPSGNQIICHEKCSLW